MKKKQCMKKWKCLLSLFLIVICMITTTVPIYAMRIETEGTKSNNAGEQDYDSWGTTVKSYLYAGEDQLLTRVEFTNNQLIYEAYNKNYKLLKKGSIKMELELFGGFYSGTDANYIVFGQNNKEEDNNKEVIRVVKYSKTWERIGSCSLSNCNTTIPFEAGSLRFGQKGKMLYIRTSHEMYTSSDGLNHQANLMMAIDTSSMKITDSFSRVMNVEYGYVSHSFNQFVQIDGEDLLAVDHGDAYPRSIVLIKYNQPAGNSVTLGTCTYMDLLKFPGKIGDNDTGASIGGFEVSDTSYLVAGNNSNNAEEMSDTDRNIFISVTPKGELIEGNTKLYYLTDFFKKDKISVSTPHLVKISNNRFMLLWEQSSGNTDSYKVETCYVIIDGNGNKVTEIQKTLGRLSDCKPIVQNNEVVWYYTDETKPIICSIPADGSKPKENLISKETYTVNGITYQISKRTDKTKTVKVSKIKDSSKKTITIPSTITVMVEKYKVTEIKDYAFESCKKTTKIVIGSNVTKIGFLGLPYSNVLKTIDIKSTKLKTIQKDAFENVSGKAVIKVPKSKLAAYKKLLAGKGQGQNVKIVS